MKKVNILLILVLLLSGCGYSGEINDKTSNYRTYCDKEYGVEYIIDNGVYRGGITVRLDENGNIIHCK